MTILRPCDAAEAAEVIAWAAAEEQSLDIVAGGSKRGLGRPAAAMHTFDSSRLSGIVDYDPSELVLTARAGTPMAEIELLLASRRQMLAFEPPDWRTLLGCRGDPTLGGVLACNLAGPRRVRAGSGRDHFLGFVGVNGRGQIWKSGGRVVKNVTGYDMCKLLAGAFGTLSLLTEITVRTSPEAETACTLLLFGLSDFDAIDALSRALNTPHEVSAAAHLPVGIANRSNVVGVATASSAVTAFRLEGLPASLASRARALEALFGQSSRLDQAETKKLWTEIGSVAPLLESTGHCIWRVCPTPSKAPELMRIVRAQFATGKRPLKAALSG